MIIHVVQHLAPGGLEVMALELARTQRALGVPAMVLSLEGEAEEAVARWPRLAAAREHLVFMGKRPGRDLGLVTRLMAFFRKTRPLAVHTHHAGPLLYAGLAARLAGIPARLHTEHDAWHLRAPRRRALVGAARALARPVMIADAPHVAQAVQEALGGAAPLVVMNGVDTARFAPGARAAARRRLGLPEQATLLGVAARLERVKGVDVALAALARLPAHIGLVVAGAGSQAEALRAQARALGIEGRVHWLGLVDDMASLHPALDLLLVPSRDEGLPLAPLEAQACGVRVVATQVGGLASAICPRTGRLVAPEDPAALAAGITRALGEEGDPRSFVVQHASLEVAAKRYMELALA